MQNLHLQSESSTREILPTLKWSRIWPQREGVAEGVWCAGVLVLTNTLTRWGTINIYNIFKMIRGRAGESTNRPAGHLLPFSELQHVKLQLSCTCFHARPSRPTPVPPPLSFPLCDMTEKPAPKTYKNSHIIIGTLANKLQVIRADK